MSYKLLLTWLMSLFVLLFFFFWPLCCLFFFWPLCCLFFFWPLCCLFFFWPLCCLFFFDIRILISPMVSSNSSSFDSNRNNLTDILTRKTAWKRHLATQSANVIVYNRIFYIAKHPELNSSNLHFLIWWYLDHNKVKKNP
jgi:hypothetical protein